MAYRHYAPKAPLAVVQGEQQAVVDIITQLVQKDIASGKKVGIICTDETRMQYHEGEIKSIGTRMKEESIAHNLYRILREFDEVEVSQIYSESFGGTGLGNSIMNRLLKAAGHEVIDATCKK
jgi:L-threonylcarbamoyladenylate synthase